VIIKVYEDKVALGRAAAARAATAMRDAISSKGKVRIIVATGASQFEFLDALTSSANIDWQKVEMFHLDEYIGLPENHPASFRKYLRERLISKTGITNYHFLEGGEAQEVIAQVGALLQSAPVDVAFVGIGENGHLAFNDPPADFEARDPYLIVTLDEPCRRQQVGEGWFSELAEVPRQAISMSVRQILQASEIIAVVPDARKAHAVKESCEAEISPLVPASILRSHPQTTLFLDRDSASLLKMETIATA
jgi:glucosamine-6-phosphate deaminase